jgi:hypothetical protein
LYLKKISGLGIEIEGADQRALLYYIACVIVYFLFAFIIYATSDFLAWLLAIRMQAISSYKEQLDYYPPPPGTNDGELNNMRRDLYTATY